MRKCLTLALATTLAAAGAARASTYMTAYSFLNGNDGSNPVAGLLNDHGILYGTTSTGGRSRCSSGTAHGCGTVFSFDPTTGAETVLYNFKDNGTDGTDPQSGLIKVGGKLFGTTAAGGAHGAGTIFSLDLKTGEEKVQYSFGTNGSGDGAVPAASLVALNGLLYGTTSNGGASSSGSIFSFDPRTGTETVVYSFKGIGSADGAAPYAGLLNVGGTLYGTTSVGGVAPVGGGGYGTVFSFNPATATEAVVYAFGLGSDGAYPYGGLIDAGGTLYGTTSAGGSGAAGTVYSVNPTTGAETIVHSFLSGSDGARPLGSLIEHAGNLFGTTSLGGGTADRGTVFLVNPVSLKEKVLHAFDGPADGTSPDGNLIYVGGTFYGTTDMGGTANDGTVFAIAP